MATTTIIVQEYPCTFNFKTRKKLPKFRYDCPTRRKILVDAMRRMKIKSPSHLYTDYVVEVIECYPAENAEVWHLGS